MPDLSTAVGFKSGSARLISQKHGKHELGSEAAVFVTLLFLFFKDLHSVTYKTTTNLLCYKLPVCLLPTLMAG